MVLYDEDELEEQKKRTAQAVITVLLLLGVFGLSYIAYDNFHPLPNTESCKEAGYEGGAILNGIELCYSGCESNTLNTCSYRGIPE